MIMKAIKRMQKAAADPEVCAVIEYREKAELDYLNRVANARLEGLLLGKEEGILLGKEEGMLLGKEEGLKEGRKEGIELIVLKMLSKKRSIEEIAEFTGLSKADILKLQQ